MDMDIDTTHAKSSKTNDVGRKRKQEDGDDAVSEFKRLDTKSSSAADLAADIATTSSSCSSTAESPSITDEDVQEALDWPNNPEWATRWLRETRCGEHWGFVRYIDKVDIRKRDSEFENLSHDEATAKVKTVARDYNSRMGSVFRSARRQASYANLMWQQFRLQGTRGTYSRSRIEKEQHRWDERADKARKRDLKELEELEEEVGGDDMDLDDEELREKDDIELVKQRFLDGEGPDRYEDDASLRAKFQYLRRRFKARRTKPRLPSETDRVPRGQGLAQGILDNVFIVVDGSCVNSHQSTATEHGWVFAVDPDYEDPGPLEPLASKVRHQYRGFIRVRLEHLVNEFFVVRKYHGATTPMEALWLEAQKSGDGLFVPSNED